MLSKNEKETRINSIYDAIKAAGSVQASLFLIRDIYEIAHVTYHLARRVTDNFDSPFVRTTYSDSWVARYLLRDYVKVDIVVEQGFQRQFAFDWADIPPTRASLEMFLDAMQYGVGPVGYSIPVTDRLGRRALVSFNGQTTAEIWKKKTLVHRDEWTDIAHVLHRKAILELYGDEDAGPPLTPRELECLRLTSHGKEYTEIGMLLNISEHTARAHLRSARYKLNCGNLTKAVAEAIKLRLI